MSQAAQSQKGKKEMNVQQALKVCSLKFLTLMARGSWLLCAKTGTSLVEMMVLLSVMLIVFSMGLVEFGDFRERAARQRAMESVAPLTKALELYKLEYSVYPDDTKAVTEVLLPYANVTSLVAQLRSPDIVTPASSASVCVSAEVKDITPTYRVTHCGQPDDLNPNNQTDVQQPVCLWTGTTWYPCQEKL